MSPAAEPSERDDEPVPTAELLARLRDAEGGDEMSLAEVAEATEGRAFGLVLLLLAIPETVPMVGLSAVIATPIFLIGAFMVWTGEEGRLPGWLSRRAVNRSLVRRGVGRALPVVKRIDRCAKPRWGALAGRTRVQGAVCVVMAVLLTIPIPGVNILAAFAVAGTGLGILQHDGMLVAAALLSAVLALAGFAAVVTGAAAIVGRVF